MAATSSTRSDLPSGHFLNLPRPDIVIGGGDGVVDTTTLAAHDFDVDTRTGFMPPDPPLSSLPAQWQPWEAALSQAMIEKLQLAIKPDLTEEEIARSAAWRSMVRELPMLSITDLTTSELLLRRAHHVLVFIMHFYIHTLPLTAPILIPESIAIPLLRVSQHLQLPPITTYSDVVLYNWDLKAPAAVQDTDVPVPTPDLNNLRSQDLFTGTGDEEEFYLASARIELRGVEAIELMRATMDEMFVGDAVAVRRITAYLRSLGDVVQDLTGLLLDVRKGCDPDVFYHQVRPWFTGQDSGPGARAWVFEGIDEHPDLEKPTDLSGTSAGQSALIHALDIFLGVGNCITGPQEAARTGTGTETEKTDKSRDPQALLRKMQIYMPRHHRAFLRHLSANPRPLRALVELGDPDLAAAYNSAVAAFKGFRDAHIRIATIYVVGPASRQRGARGEEDEGPVKGTGGTPLIQFLKGARDNTADAMVAVPSPP
ncbi:hypothetical protein ID866_4345 [Astraeus odoratus]|nr:hypothetical protein ID866_4345 [Astraeus odoratus]